MCSYSFFQSSATYILLYSPYLDFINGTHRVEVVKSNKHENLINLAVNNFWSPPVFVFVLLDGILPTKPPPEHMFCSIVCGDHFKNLGSVHLWLVGSSISAEYDAMCYKKNWFNNKKKCKI